MLVDRIVKETTDVSRVIVDLDEFLDDSEVVMAIYQATITQGTTGWGLVPYPPAAAPAPYDPTPLLFRGYTLDQSNRTLIFFVEYGTPGLFYTCTFVLGGTSARSTTIEVVVQIQGVPPVQADVPLPADQTAPAPSHALPISGGQMTGPLYLFEDPVYPTEAASKNYVDHVAGVTGGPFLALAGGIMTGPLQLYGAPQYPNDAATKTYVDNVIGTAGWLPISGGTMQGPLVLAADPTVPLGAAPKRYVDGSLAAYLPLSGGTMTGTLMLAADPVTAMQAATKEYVDGATTTANNTGRNYIHNYVFVVAQRGAGPFTTNNGYTLDRWVQQFSLDTQSITQRTLLDVDRAAVGDEAARYSLNVQFTGNAGAGAFNTVSQRVERVQRLSGKTITVSFWAIGSAALNLGLQFLQVFGTGGSPSATVTVLPTGASFQVTTTWARYFVTLAIPSSAGKVFGTNSDDYTSMRFAFSSGATNNQIYGNIGVQSGTIQLWGIQLEYGTVATPVVRRDPVDELGLCQRFYLTAAFNVPATAATQLTITYPTSMRAVPTITGGGAGFTVSAQTSAIAASFYQTTAAVQTLGFSADL